MTKLPCEPTGTKISQRKCGQNILILESGGCWGYLKLATIVYDPENIN